MIIVGHRGAAGLGPENTLKALEKGLEHHADEIEFDLRVTKDNVVILHHDEFVTGPRDERHMIAALTFASLSEHKPDLTTFEAALDTINHRAKLYVEVKPEVPTMPIIDIIKRRLDSGWRTDEFKLASFSQSTLLELHEALPEIDKVVLESWKSIRARRRARQVETHYISMNQKWLWSGFIKAVSRGGWKLYAYTLNDPAKARRWQKYRLYAVITDYPDQFEGSPK